MSVGHIPPPLVKKSGRLTNMCIGEASSKSCFCRNCINAMKRIQCQKPLNGRREGTYKPQMPKQKNGRGRLKVEALKNAGANKPLAQVQPLARKNCQRTQNAPWSSLGG